MQLGACVQKNKNLLKTTIFKNKKKQNVKNIFIFFLVCYLAAIVCVRKLCGVYVKNNTVCIYAEIIVESTQLRVYRCLRDFLLLLIMIYCDYL